MTGIGMAGAFLGGVLSLLSPCSALLLPSFFAFALGGWRNIIASVLVFWAGLTLVLAPLGAGVGWLGSILTAERGWVTAASGGLLIFFGLLMVFGKGFGSGRLGAVRARGDQTRPVALLVLGMVYGLAGFCSGPLLGSVLALSLAGGQALHGAWLMSVYGAGMVLPLVVLALLWQKFDLGSRRWLRGRPVSLGAFTVHSTQLLSGLVFMGLGLLFLLTEGTASLPGAFSVDQQFEWQEAIQRWSAGEGPLLTAMAFVVTLMGVLGFRMARRRTGIRAEESPGS